MFESLVDTAAREGACAIDIEIVTGDQNEIKIEGAVEGGGRRLGGALKAQLHEDEQDGEGHAEDGHQGAHRLMQQIQQYQWAFSSGMLSFAPIPASRDNGGRIFVHWPVAISTRT